MAVNLPQRVGVVLPSSSGRVQSPNVDVITPMEKISNAVEGVVDEGLQYQQRQEVLAIDTEKNRLSNQLEKTYRTRLAQAKQQEGDPDVIYRQFDEEVQKDFQTLMTDNQNLSGSARDLVGSALESKLNVLEVLKVTQREEQVQRYEDNIRVDTVNLAKNRMIDAAKFIKADDELSFANFDHAMSEITNTNLNYGLKFGTVTEDPKGGVVINGNRVKLLPSVEYRIKKDLSDGVKNTIDILIKSGEIEKAKLMQDKYGDFMNAVDKKALVEPLEREEINQQAYKIVAEVEGKNLDSAQREKLLGQQPLRVQDKALEILDTRSRRFEYL